MARARLEALHEELAVVSEPRTRALLDLELGALYEHTFGDRAQALACYRSAHERQPAMLAPMLSIARVTSAEPSLAAQAWQAYAASSDSPRDRADALCEAGILLCDELNAKDSGLALLRQALEVDATCSTAALLLEYEARAARDPKEAERVNALHARAVGDVELKASLLLEIAAAEQRDGHGVAALSRLAEAGVLGARTRAVFSATERVARAQHHPARLLAALDALAARAEQTEREADEAGEAVEQPRSVALQRQAARTAAAELADTVAAAERQTRALIRGGRDPLLLWERIVLLHERAQPEDAIRAARALLDVTGDTPLSAAVHLRYAELLDMLNDAEGSLTQRRLAALRDPASASTIATLEDALLWQGRPQLLCDHLLVRAERTSGQARAEHLMHAGRIAVFKLRDNERGLSLLRRAVECSVRPEVALRTLYTAAVWSGDHETAVDAAQALCGRQLEPAERTLLRFDQYERLRRAGDTDSALALLEAALLESTNVAWAAPAARVEGAAHHNHRLLADAHRALAQRSPDPAHAAAHLGAAARSLLRAGEAAAAVAELRLALAQAPNDAYALALLEECLITAGEGREAARMLRDAAQSHESARRRELALLHAGSAAEAVFDREAAARSYLEAASLDTSTIAPLWSLRRLSERSADNVLLLQALTQLAAREARGAPGLAQLELGEFLAGHATFEPAAEALAKVLDNSELAAAAALGLWLLPESAVPAQARADAERVLLEAGEPLRAALLRERIARQGAHGETPAQELTQALDEYPDDRSLACAALDESQDAQQRANALLRLGRISDDASVGAELTLHSIRTALLARGSDAGGECALHALQAVQRVPGSLSAAIALDETLGAGDDPESRAEALAARIAHATPDAQKMLFAARARALLAAGRAQDAADAARRMLAQDGEDLTALELLRTAARALGDFAVVADAARRLADHATGRQRTLLLEEAADALDHEPDRDDDAEECLRLAFAHEPTTEVAFVKLHDRLLDRGELPELVEVIERRLVATLVAKTAPATEPELLELRYEYALALRATGRKEEALRALDEVLTADPTHAAALGLRVETCTALEDWPSAVSALRRLADAPVPVAQKRLARLGAAEFLERRLNNPAAACAELRALDASGINDHAVLVRLAVLCERAAQYREAVDACRRAAAQVSGAAAAALELRAGDILHQHLGAQNEAELAYARALAADPLAVDAYARLLDRTTQAHEREALIGRLERSVRAALEREPAQPQLLRHLLQAARWAQRSDVELTALSVLGALGVSDDDERDALRCRLTDRARAPRDEDARALRRLGGSAESAALAHPAQLASLALSALDGDEQPESPFSLAAELARTSDGAQRFDLGRQALARALGVWPLARRTRAAQRDALRACASLAGRAQGAEIDELGKRIGKQLARAQRKDLTRGIETAGDAIDLQIESYLDALDAGLVRAGVLLAGDVGAAWARSGPLSGSAGELDLLRFWLSPRALELLREVGWVA